MRPLPVANIKTAEHRVYRGLRALFKFSDKATASFTLSRYLFALCCNFMLLNAPYLSCPLHVYSNGRAAIVISIRRGGGGRRSQLCPRRPRRQAAAPAKPRFNKSGTRKSPVELNTWPWCGYISATAPADFCGF